MNVRTLKLKDELAEFISLIVTQRNALAKRIKEGTLLDKTALNATVMLSTAFEKATKCRIQIDKAEKDREEALSPEEELEEIKKYILTFDHVDRLDIINDLASKHNVIVRSTGRGDMIRMANAGV